MVYLKLSRKHSFQILTLENQILELSQTIENLENKIEELEEEMSELKECGTPRPDWTQCGLVTLMKSKVIDIYESFNI